MGTLKRVRIFLRLDTKTMFLFLEAILYLGWARLLIFTPFSKVSSSLGVYMQETPDSEILADRSALRNVYQAVHMVSHHTFWECKCLVRAIAAMKMLERRRIDSTLYLGTAKDESGKMVAHAWLRSGPFYITGAEEIGGFTVVGKFAKITGREKKKGN